MKEAVSTILDSRAATPSGLSRLISWSFALHITVAVVVLLWQSWLAGHPKDDNIMMISIAGAPGISTGGLTEMGGKQVDEVAPPPKRVEPTPVPSAPKNEITLPTKSTTTKQPPPKSSTVPQTSSV